MSENPHLVQPHAQSKATFKAGSFSKLDSIVQGLVFLTVGQ